MKTITETSECRTQNRNGAVTVKTTECVKVMNSLGVIVQPKQCNVIDKEDTDSENPDSSDDEDGEGENENVQV